MNHVIRAAALVGISCVMYTADAQAQKEPARPRLEAAADTNNAQSYYRLGVSQLSRNPGDAADAFYWATRIDPTRADAYYGRRVAILMSNPRVLMRYMDGERRTLRSREVQTADSLFRRALMLEPFMYRDLDRHMISEYVSEWGRQLQAEGANIDLGSISFILERLLRESGPYLRGWLAYTEHRLPEALDLYQRALKQSRTKAPLHADRAHILFLTGDAQAAAAEMTSALAELSRDEQDDEVVLYYSKAFYEFGLGMSLESSLKFDDALAAYGRALQEDLSYYPAHRRMASIALMRGDTAGAMASLALGSSIDEADIALRYDYAVLLLQTGDTEQAAEQMEAVTAREPWFASGWLVLGASLDQGGRAEQAAAAYDRYLALAERDSPQRDAVAAHVASLRGAKD